jgi:hypothetical protein
MRSTLIKAYALKEGISDAVITQDPKKDPRYQEYLERTNPEMYNAIAEDLRNQYYTQYAPLASQMQAMSDDELMLQQLMFLDTVQDETLEAAMLEHVRNWIVESELYEEAGPESDVPSPRTAKRFEEDLPPQLREKLGELFPPAVQTLKGMGKLPRKYGQPEAPEDPLSLARWFYETLAKSKEKKRARYERQYEPHPSGTFRGQEVGW